MAHATEGEIDQRMRPLRDSGVLPMGGRGPHAPNIDETHAAMMILQMVSRRVADAHDVGLQASILRFAEPPGLSLPFGMPHPKAMNLPAALIFLFQHPEFPWRKLDIAVDGTVAWLTIDRDGLLFDLLFISNPDRLSEVQANIETYRGFGMAYCGHRFVLGAGALHVIAAPFNRPTQSGWVGEENA